MSIKDKIEALIKNKNDSKKLIEATYQENLADPKIEDAEKATVEQIISKMKDKNINTENILKDAIDSEKTPDSVFISAAKKIEKDDNISNSTIVKAIETSKRDVPDEIIAEVLKGNKSFKTDEEITLLNNINNNKIKEKQVINILENYYNKDFSDIKDNSVIDKLNKLYKAIEFKSDNVDEIVQKIVAKKMAVNIEKFKSTMIRNFSTIPNLSLKDMMRLDMPQIVNEEYKKLNENNKEGINVSELRCALLNEMSNEIAKEYNKYGYINIPQSDAMKNLTAVEEESFIKNILIKTKIKNNTKNQNKNQNKNKINLLKEDISNKIRDRYKDKVKQSEVELIKKISNYSNSEQVRILSIFNAMAGLDNFQILCSKFEKSPEKFAEILSDVASTDLIDNILKVPDQKRKEIFETISNSLNNTFSKEEKTEER